MASGIDLSFLTAPPTVKEYLSRFNVVRPDDPILRLAQDLGFKVTLYTPKPARWDLFYVCFQHAQMFQLALATTAYFVAKQQPGLQRSAFVGILVLTLISWPAIYGKTGLGLVDFGLPAIGFLASLHMIDIFYLRPRHEVQSWSFARFYCQLLAFPKEEQNSNSPRWQNFKSLGLCIVKLLTVNLMLYGVPAPHLLDQIHSWPAFIGYNMAVGGCILQTLGFLIEGTFLANGIVWGIEMEPMFNYPLAQSNLRAFWGNWNLAIKDALHRVAFAAGKVQKKIKEEANKPGSIVGKANSKANGKANGKASKFHHKDQLSETEGETESEDGGSKANGGAASGKSSAQEQKVAAARRKGVDVSKPKSGAGKKKGSGFAKKAAAATFTFLVSGLFHEYMNHLAFDGATGENVAFFLAHAFGTITYVWIGKNLPSVRDNTPTWAGILITDLFLFVTTPLFCMPFLRAGLFEDLKAAGMFGPVRGFIWVWGS